MNKRYKWVAGGTVAVLAIAAIAYTVPGLFFDRDTTSAPVKQIQENGRTVKEFEITAKTATHELKNGVKFEAYTYNGSVPGTQIRVTEGDRVRIKFKNELPERTAIHWHGVPVPNAMDGVPGVTMNALKTGESFTYEFDATVPGTYMYHSHQNSADQIDKGLYGTLIVEPKNPSVKYDKDFTLVLDEWSTMMLGVGGNMSGSGMAGMDHGSMNHDAMQQQMNQTGMSHDAMMKQMYDIFTVNGKAGDQIKPLEVKAGERVKLRFVNVGYQSHKLHLPGQPFKVTHTDGQPIDNGGEVTDQLLVIAPGERYDIEFVAGSSGFVIDDHNNSAASADIRIPVRVQGETAMNNPNDSKQNLPELNIAAYAKASQPFGDKKPTLEYTMNLNNEPLGGMEEKFTINGKTFPNTDPIQVKKGDIVKVKLVNKGTADHPMHLHGHFFQVISKNGQPIPPLTKDTLNVKPNEEYEVVFEANNDGNWVFHCHDLHHAAGGMVTVVKYEGFKPNFTPDPNDKPE